MRKSAVSLDVISIENPCPAAWDKMRGDDRVRFCTECNLHVFNLSEMTREAAQSLLEERGATQGRLCVRLYKRSDGTVITRDCGGGLRAAARRAAKRAAAAASLVLCAALSPVLLLAESTDRGGVESRAQLLNFSRDPISAIREWLLPRRAPVMMGAIAAPPPTTAPTAPVRRVEMGDVAIQVMGEMTAPPQCFPPTTAPTTAPAAPATQPSPEPGHFILGKVAPKHR